MVGKKAKRTPNQDELEYKRLNDLLSQASANTQLEWKHARYPHPPDSHKQKHCGYCNMELHKDGRYAPMKCDRCNGVFCIYHAGAKNHACKGVDWNKLEHEKHAEHEEEWKQYNARLEKKREREQIYDIALVLIISSIVLAGVIWYSLHPDLTSKNLIANESTLNISDATNSSINDNQGNIAISAFNITESKTSNSN